MDVRGAENGRIFDVATTAEERMTILGAIKDVGMHVPHPSLRGNRLFAQTVVRAVQENVPLPRAVLESWHGTLGRAGTEHDPKVLAARAILCHEIGVALERYALQP